MEFFFCCCDRSLACSFLNSWWILAWFLLLFYFSKTAIIDWAPFGWSMLDNMEAAVFDFYSLLQWVTFSYFTSHHHHGWGGTISAKKAPKVFFWRRCCWWYIRRELNHRRGLLWQPLIPSGRSMLDAAFVQANPLLFTSHQFEVVNLL